MTIDSKTLAELSAMHAAATPEPWVWGGCRDHPNKVETCWQLRTVDGQAIPNLSPRDMKLAAAARNALPHLIARIRKLEADARPDTARLEFVLGVLNAREAFSDFCEDHHPRLSTSQGQASVEQWRAAIDAAMAVRG